MKTKRLKILAAATALSTFGLVLGASSPDSTLKDLAGYRSWTRATDKPMPVENASFAG